MSEPKLGEFELRRVGDGWSAWEVWHKGRQVMTVAGDVARAIMLRHYDPAALARGELVKAGSDGRAETRK